MTKQKQRAAIAEACGWKKRDPVGFSINALPDYLNDLNAMHEAEQIGQSYAPGFWTAYTAGLRIAGAHQIVHATAAQRAEAFLKTLRKWKE